MFLWSSLIISPSYFQIFQFFSYQVKEFQKNLLLLNTIFYHTQKCLINVQVLINGQVGNFGKNYKRMVLNKHTGWFIEKKLQQSYRPKNCMGWKPGPINKISTRYFSASYRYFIFELWWICENETLPLYHINILLMFCCLK